MKTRNILIVAILGAVSVAAQTSSPTAPRTAGAATQSVPSYKDLKFPPLRAVNPPVPATITLSNGMRVFLLEDHELPLIHGLALVRTGNLFDPPEKRGLADITAEVIRSGGTKSKSGDQIDEELENVAASVESNMGETSASVSFSGLKESSDAVLAVFKDVLSNPVFRQDKLDLALMQARSGIARRNDEASAIAERELSNILYGRDTPYGWEIEYANLDQIHRDDLVRFYQRYYFPKNIMIGIYGDFSTSEMEAKLEKLFGDWKAEQSPAPPFPPVTAKAAPGVYLGGKERRHADVFFHRRTRRHIARSRLSGFGSRHQYPGGRIYQPADVGDPHQTRLRLWHRCGLGGQLRPSRDVPYRRQHEIRHDHGDDRGHSERSREDAHGRGHSA